MFGSTCFVLCPQVERSKLSSCYAICIFLGYVDDQKGYHCYDTSEKKLYVSHHVVFLEHIPFYLLSSDSHITSSSKLTHIDPFGHNDNISSDYNFENYRIDTTTTPDTDIPLVYSIIPSVTVSLLNFLILSIPFTLILLLIF